MADERIEWALGECERNGLAWARVFIEGQENSHFGLDVRHWIAKKEQQERDASSAEQRRLAEAAIAEAKSAAGAAREAALASKAAARWTMIAALVAGLSTIVTAGVAYAQFRGWMPR